MSDKNRKLAIPNHLRLDSLSLSCISTGLTPRTEIKNRSTGNVITNGLDSERYLELKRRLSVQLPTNRSLRTSIRINRSSNISQLNGDTVKNSSEINPTNVFRDQPRPLRVNRNNVTTPKGFDFATSERAEQRLRHNRSSSGSILSLNLHQLNNFKVANAPLSARSSSSIGAESRISTQSRMTTVPKPFNFATDARAASKSKELYGKLGVLKDRFNQEVLTKNNEFCEQKRLNSIIDSISNCSNSSIYDVGSTELSKDLEYRSRREINRRSVTIPKSPKFATQLRSESKKAQLRGVLDSLILIEENEGIEKDKTCKVGMIKRAEDVLKLKSLAVKETQLEQTDQKSKEDKHLSDFKNSNDIRNGFICKEMPDSQPQLTKFEMGNEIKEKSSNSLFSQPQKLPKLRGFLSMNSFAHMGKQSFSLDNSKESVKMLENLSSLNQKPVLNIDSIKQINIENNVPDNWKFQATVARKQLEQLTCYKENDLSIDEISSINQDKFCPKSSYNNGFSDEDVRTPLPRSYK